MHDFNSEIVKAVRGDLATARRLDTIAQRQYFNDGKPESLKKGYCPMTALLGQRGRYDQRS